jgi:hypothetical protein
MGLLSVSHEKKTVERYYLKWTLLNLPESPLLCMGMNGSPERGGGTEAQVVGFKEAPPFGRGASLGRPLSERGNLIFSGKD